MRGISYDPEHVCVMLEPQDGPNWLEITEEEARQIVTLSNNLVFRRSVLHIPCRSTLQPVSPGHYRAPENESIHLRISRPDSDYLSVTCALGEKGFAYYEGTYCVEEPYGRVYGWEPLVAYLRELAVKYGIELPVW